MRTTTIMGMKARMSRNRQLIRLSDGIVYLSYVTIVNYHRPNGFSVPFFILNFYCDLLFTVVHIIWKRNSDKITTTPNLSIYVKSSFFCTWCLFFT